MSSSTPLTTARGEVIYPAPGAFPTDDLTRPEPTNVSSLDDATQRNDHHHDRNKLRKPQFKDVSGANHEDTLLGTKTLESRNADIAEPKYHATAVNQSSKPGVMTGAYSRLPIHNQGHDHGSPASNNPILAGNSTTSSRNHNQPTAEHRGKNIGNSYATSGGLAAATATAVGTTSHSSASPGYQSVRDQSSAHGSSPQQDTALERERNLVRNGRDHSSLEHQDPYWGDVPYGTGVYNTVSGHGSAEDPQTGTVRSGHPRETGPAHGVTHSLDQSQVPHTTGTQNSPSTSKAPLTAHEGQQRVFPLTDNDRGHDGVNQTIHEQQAHSNRNSRFNEELAGAGIGGGAAVGAGYMASGLGGKEEGNRLPGEHERNNVSGQSYNTEARKAGNPGGLVAGLPPHDHKDKYDKHETKPVEYTGNNNKLVPGTSSHHPRQGKDVVEKDNSKGYTKEAGAAGGVALAAGTAAYGAHEYATRGDKVNNDSKHPGTSFEEEPEKKESKLHALFHRSHPKDNDHDKGDENAKSTHTAKEGAATKTNQNAYNNTTTRAGAEKQNPFLAAGYHPSATAPRAAANQRRAGDYTQPAVREREAKHGIDNSTLGLGLGAGTATGAAAGAGYVAHKHAHPTALDTTSTTTAVPHPRHGSEDVSPTTISPPTPSPSSAHYKVLASGTPSGIAVDSQTKASPAAPGAGAGLREDEGATHPGGYRYASGAAGAGVLGAGAGAGAAAGRRKGSEEERGQRAAVVHRCQKCGEENDITLYVRSEDQG